jgi:hypothetical protein
MESLKISLSHFLPLAVDEYFPSGRFVLLQFLLRHPFGLWKVALDVWKEGSDRPALLGIVRKVIASFINRRFGAEKWAMQRSIDSAPRDERECYLPNLLCACSRAHAYK